jgi:monothiol glutaredoxin
MVCGLISQEELEAKKQEIKKDIKDHKVVLYMKGDKQFPQCGYSAHAVELLESSGADFVTRDVLQDPALRQAIKVFSNWPTLPQLYIDQEFIGGADIIQELFASGQLQQILQNIHA